MCSRCLCFRSRTMPPGSVASFQERGVDCCRISREASTPAQRRCDHDRLARGAWYPSLRCTGSFDECHGRQSDIVRTRMMPVDCLAAMVTAGDHDASANRLRRSRRPACRYFLLCLHDRCGDTGGAQPPTLPASPTDSACNAPGLTDKRAVCGKGAANWIDRGPHPVPHCVS